MTMLFVVLILLYLEISICMQFLFTSFNYFSAKAILAATLEVFYLKYRISNRGLPVIYSAYNFLSPFISWQWSSSNVLWSLTSGEENQSLIGSLPTPPTFNVYINVVSYMHSLPNPTKNQWLNAFSKSLVRLLKQFSIPLYREINVILCELCLKLHFLMCIISG